MIVKSSQTFVWSSTARYRRAICWMYLWYLWRNEAVLFLHWHMVHYVSWHASSSPAPHQRSLQPTILHCRPGDAAANGCGDTAANVTFCIFFLRIPEQSRRISTVLWLLCSECYLVYSVVGSVAEVEAAVAELLYEAVHLVHLAVLPVQLLLAAAPPPRQLPYCNIFC